MIQSKELNNHPFIKRGFFVDKESLLICETFESIQGETSLAGIPTTFVRLSLCPLRCTWCDSTYSHAPGTKMSISSIIDIVDQYGWRAVCVTGGEPLYQAATIPLLTTLIEKKYSVSLETNGALSISEVPEGVKVILDIKCPSSNMSHTTNFSNIDLIDDADEVKFVIADRTDYEYARDCTHTHKLFSKTANVLISPVYGRLEPKQLIGWALQDKLPFRFNLQIHKYVWDVTKRGV
jgi:7-carboxy-7-deazaguanine synthase